MKNVTKKIISLFFILLGFIPMLFVFLVTIKKQDIRSRMNEKLEHQVLQTIVLPEQDIIWAGKYEIRVNGQLFDISTAKLENGIYLFTGLYDMEETALEEFEKEAGSNAAGENKLLAGLFDCLQNIFHSQQADCYYSAGQQNNRINNAAPETISPFREILTPPPQSRNPV